MGSADRPTSTIASNDSPAPATGYRKGEESRQRILKVALKAFGEAGFKGATTRHIAEQAKVNLPALKYYFGGKEGLYLACAREIVARYEKGMLAPLTTVVANFDGRMGAEAAKAHLKAIVGALIEMQIGDESEPGMAFALREMAEQGPAFDILFDSFWSPGIELISCLISRARREADKSEAARVEALLLLSSLSAFSIARPIAMRHLNWVDTRGARKAQIRQVLEDQIDRIC